MVADENEILGVRVEGVAIAILGAQITTQSKKATQRPVLPIMELGLEIALGCLVLIPERAEIDPLRVDSEPQVGVEAACDPVAERRRPGRAAGGGVEVDQMEGPRDAGLAELQGRRAAEAGAAAP